MTRFLYLLFTFLYFNMTPVTGQTTPASSFIGRVMSSTSQPASFATIRLQWASDSTFLMGTVCDIAGLYTIERVRPGAYRVVASLVGYGLGTSQLVTVTEDSNRVTVNTIYLSEKSNTLNEVNVRAAKPFVEQLPDRTVLNVESSLVVAGGTALDVLERAPGVVVDQQNDQIQLQGRSGVLIMMDDKPTYLSMADVVNLLRHTPANSIETIELITKPSARYDAAGNAGIINIRLKCAKPLTRKPLSGTEPYASVPTGTNGTASFASGYGRFPKLSGGMLINHRTVGGWTLFANYTYDYRAQWSSMDAWRSLKNDMGTYRVRNLGYRPSQTDVHTYKVGADYGLNARNTLGLVVNGSVIDVQGQTTNENLIYSPKGAYRSAVHFMNVTSRAVNRFVTNANFRHRFDSSGRSLSIDVDFSTINTAPYDSMVTRATEPISSSISPAALQRNLSPSRITIRSAKADYVHPLGKMARVETGWKSSYVTTDNDMQFDNWVGGGWQPNPQRTNHFVYDETIHAAYVSGNRDWSAWALQVGLRAEYTRSKGNSITLGTVVERQYLDLFPSVFLTRKLGKEHQLRYAFSRRIDRPNYQQLNPFIYILDTYTYGEGDPFLRPQYMLSFELGYTYKNETSLTLSYNRSNDVIAHINEQKGELLRVGPANLTQQDNYNLAVSFPLKPARWWNLRTSVSAFVNVYDAVVQNQPVENRGLAANLTMSHSFVLPSNITAELSGYYNSPYVDGITRGYSDGQLSVGVQKQLWAKRATLRLNVSDVFFTSRFAGLIQHGQTDLYWVSRCESRIARLAFTYNFGNQKLKNGGQRRSGAEDEQRRSAN